MGNKQATYRNKVRNFWQTYCMIATLDAFDVSSRTLYNWRNKRDFDGLPALSPHSKAPKTIRHRQWNKRIIAQIKQLRRSHPNIGKHKVYPLLHISF